MEKTKQQRFTLTRLERAWVLYDVGNSAFVLMVATLIPIFFNALAAGGGLSSVEYLAYWGYASSVVTVITAVLSPILGTLADTKGYKKPIFLLCVWVGIVGCIAMGKMSAWLPFLVIFVIAKVGFSGSLVYYDAMLADVTTPERMDEVSSKGYAWGYIGSCVPFVACLGLVLGADKLGMTQMKALDLALLVTAFWWLLTTLPLVRQYKQLHYVEVEKHAVRQSFARIGHTLRHLPEDKQVFWFLLAFFCYIDGVYTIIDMATAYGTALGLDTTGLLLALLLTQIVAFPSALIFGRLSGKYPSSTLIPVCIAAYAGIAVFAFFLVQQWQFWVLAVIVGMFQGGVQALSRSHFAKIIPPEKSGEYFGLFDICGKGASFLGHHDRQRGQPADRQCQRGRGLSHRAVRGGVRAVPGVVQTTLSGALKCASSPEGGALGRAGQPCGTHRVLNDAKWLRSCGKRLRGFFRLLCFTGRRDTIASK